MALIDLGVICRKVVIVKIRPATFIGLNNRAVNYTMVLIFGLALFLLSSIQLFDALAIIAVVTTQVTLGGFIWRKIRGAGPLEHYEFLGMGQAKKGQGKSCVRQSVRRPVDGFWAGMTPMPG